MLNIPEPGAALICVEIEELKGYRPDECAAESKGDQPKARTAVHQFFIEHPRKQNCREENPSADKQVCELVKRIEM